MMTQKQSNFTITYDFPASKKAVFNAFSDIKSLNQWWGPVECKNTALKLDFKKGGTFFYKMEKNGHVNYGQFTFVDIQPYDVLEFTNSFADEKGNIIRAPFDLPLPLKIFYRLVFTQKGSQTRITMTAQAVDATQEERLALESIYLSMEAGFGATFEKLKMYLNNNKNN